MYVLSRFAGEQKVRPAFSSRVLGREEEERWEAMQYQHKVPAKHNAPFELKFYQLNSTNHTVEIVLRCWLS